jgi:hypothetical protein
MFCSYCSVVGSRQGPAVELHFRDLLPKRRRAFDVLMLILEIQR